MADWRRRSALEVWLQGAASSWAAATSPSLEWRSTWSTTPWHGLCGYRLQLRVRLRVWLLRGMGFAGIDINFVFGYFDVFGYIVAYAVRAFINTGSVYLALWALLVSASSSCSATLGNGLCWYRLRARLSRCVRLLCGMSSGYFSNTGFGYLAPWTLQVLTFLRLRCHRGLRRLGVAVQFGGWIPSASCTSFW